MKCITDIVICSANQSKSNYSKAPALCNEPLLWDKNVDNDLYVIQENDNQYYPAPDIPNNQEGGDKRMCLF